MSNFQKCVLVVLCLNFNDMLCSMSTVYRPDFSAYNARKNEFLPNIQNVDTATDHEKMAKTDMEEGCVNAINSGDITLAIRYFKSSMSCNSYQPTARVFVLAIKGLRIIGVLSDDVVIYDYGGMNANVRKAILETSDKHLEILFGILSTFVKTKQNFSDDEFCEYLTKRIQSQSLLEKDMSFNKDDISPIEKIEEKENRKRSLTSLDPLYESKRGDKQKEECKKPNEDKTTIEGTLIGTTTEITESMLQHDFSGVSGTVSPPTNMPKPIKRSEEERKEISPKKKRSPNMYKT